MLCRGRDITGGEVTPEGECGRQHCAGFAKTEVEESVAGVSAEGALESTLELVREW